MRVIVHIRLRLLSIREQLLPWELTRPAGTMPGNRTETAQDLFAVAAAFTICFVSEKFLFGAE
jgi:hypothetical protein